MMEIRRIEQAPYIQASQAVRRADNKKKNNSERHASHDKNDKKDGDGHINEYA